MDREMGNGKEFGTGNGREMGNGTEFETGNGRKWESIRYEKHHFSTGNEKNKRIQAKMSQNGPKIGQKASFSTGNGKNTRNTGTGKTRYNMIWRNVIREKFEHSGNPKNDVQKRERCLPECHGMTIREQIRYIVPPLAGIMDGIIQRNTGHYIAHSITDSKAH